MVDAISVKLINSNSPIVIISDTDSEVEESTNTCAVPTETDVVPVVAASQGFDTSVLVHYPTRNDIFVYQARSAITP